MPAARRGEKYAAGEFECTQRRGRDTLSLIAPSDNPREACPGSRPNPIYNTGGRTQDLPELP